jgi:mannitol operon transcriptional antiterminator
VGVEMYITPRQRKILKALLNRPEPYSSAELAKSVQLSLRTLQRELRTTEQIVIEHDLQLQNGIGSGIALLGSEEKKEQLQQLLLEKKNESTNGEERKQWIFCDLLESSEPLMLSKWVSQFQVTPNMIGQDLHELSQWLWQYRLQLQHQRRNGVKLQGHEQGKRRALGELISQQLSLTELIALLRQQLERNTVKKGSFHSYQMLEQFSPDILTAVELALQNLNESLDQPLSASAWLALVVHLASALERIQKGEKIELKKEQLQQVKKTPQFATAQEIVKRLQNMLPLTIPIEETGHIALHLQKAQFASEPLRFEQSEWELTGQARQLIEVCEQELGIEISKDPSLQTGLLTHLRGYQEKLARNRAIKNPLYHKTKSLYPDLFALMTKACQEIFPSWNIPEEEITNLVLHIASAVERMQQNTSPYRALIVCPSGAGTSKMLASRIEREIPLLSAADSTSAFEVQEKDIEAYDVIISTVPIPVLRSHDYLLVSPMLSTEEAEQIRQHIASLEKKAQPEERLADGITDLDILTSIHQSLGAILELMSQFALTTLENGQSPIDQLIHFIAEDLQEQKVTMDSQSLAHELMEQIQRQQVVLHEEQIAVFRCKSQHVRAPFFTIYLLTDPILLHDPNNQQLTIRQLVFLLEPEEVEKIYAETMNEIYALLLEPETLKRCKTEDPNLIQSYFLQQLHEFSYGR